MIIHEPEVKNINGEIIISSRIERVSELAREWPDQLYFAFPELYQDYLKVSLDPFYFSMIIPAMRLGENIQLRGAISPLLALGLQEYQAIFRQAHGEWARHSVEIEYAGFSKEDISHPNERFGATSFSGGIDSTFSCFFLKEEQQEIPYANLQYALFIQGVDNPLNDTVGFLQLAHQFSDFLQPRQIELITARTNFILFSQFLLPWILLPQVPLLSTAMLLRGRINRFFIPGADSYDHFSVAGSSFLSDHWVGTEDFSVFQLGRHALLQKLSYVNQISEYPAILRVCANKKISLHVHCGHCAKCLRTMSFLALLGDYSKYKTFPQPFSTLYILEWGWKYYTGRVTFQNFIKAAWQKKKYDFFVLGIFALLLSRINNYLRTLIRWVMPEKLLIQWKQKMFVKEEDVKPDIS